MLTSWSEASTPAELSMASVLTRMPASAASTRPSWVRPEVAALADDPDAQLRPSTRIASLALSPTWALDSRRRLDVGADAAVPQQVDRRLEDRGDELGRGQRRDRRRQRQPRARPAA